MIESPKIVVVAGTNRPHSLTAQVADYYVSLLAKYACSPQVLKLVHLPADFTVTAMYAHKGTNPAFNLLRMPMEEGEKYVFVVPEYNGSFPGVLKAFIDGLQFPDTFKGKKCALVGVSKGSQGGALALSHLTDIFHYLKMHVYPLKPRLSHVHDSKLDTLLANPQYVHLLQEQAEAIVQY